MPRKKKTPIDVIADRICTAIEGSNKTAAEEIRSCLPELIVQAFGLPTATDAIADHVAGLVVKAKTLPAKRKPGRPKKQKAAEAETSGTSQRATRTKRKSKKAAKRKVTKRKVTKRKATKTKATKTKATKAVTKKAKSRKVQPRKTTNGVAAAAYDHLRKRAAQRMRTS